MRDWSGVGRAGTECLDHLLPLLVGDSEFEVGILVVYDWKERTQ